MDILLIIIIGLVVGSFLNVCIYRIPRDMSIVKPRSKCTNCDHQIKAWENIPLISYILLGGKCSNCKTKISIRYPMVELLNAVVYYQIYYFVTHKLSANNPLIAFALIAFLFSIVLVLTFIDIDFQILPNRLLLLSIIPIVLFLGLYRLNHAVDHILGSIILLAIFLIIGYLGKIVYKVDSMGMGDVKYATIIGLFLGWKLGLLAFVISFFSAALLILVLSLTQKIKRKQRLAFGPFLSIGLFVAFFWGTKIINWYLGFYGA